jgi:hypothetical protein
MSDAKKISKAMRVVMKHRSQVVMATAARKCAAIRQTT